jgi:hypothetical protein
LLTWGKGGILMANTYLSKDGKYFTLNGKLLQYLPAPLVTKGDLIKLDLDGNGDK